MVAYWLLLKVFQGTEASFLGRHFYLPPFVISSFLAIVNNYELNRFWTFREWHEHSMGFARYLSMAAVTLVFDMALLFVFVDWVGLTPLLAAGIAIIVVFITRYAIATKWIWSRRHDKNRTTPALMSRERRPQR